MTEDVEQAAVLADGEDFAELEPLVHDDNRIWNDTLRYIRWKLALHAKENLLDEVGTIDFLRQRLAAARAEERLLDEGGTIDDDSTNDDIADVPIPEDGGELANEPEILRSFAEDLELAGLAGEQCTAQIIYLAATSRLFPSPLSVAVKGPSSGGKSHTVQHALRFLPPEACFTLTSMSERTLIYTDEDLSHRMLVLYEADAITRGGKSAYILRTLLSEGEIRHEVVAKSGRGFTTAKIRKNGPTGLIVTTTATGLDPELETRLLSLTVTDTPAQTKAVFRALARNHNASGPIQVNFERWHHLQRWLADGDRNVVVPFAEQLADRVLALAVRQRRDFSALLTLIRAHALLHRSSRSRDEDGAIIATIEDYAVVRALVADLFAEGIEATVSVTVRETVDAVAALKKDEVSLGELTARLRLDKSVASRRLRQATELGYLVNRETRSGRPARIVLGDVLPDEVQVLPEPDQLVASPCVAVLHYDQEGIADDGIVSRDDPEELTPVLELAPAAVEEDAAGTELVGERIQQWFEARRT